ncbi:LysR family transcriptional regulator substrate-binding protein [Streptomyces hirsutus]|uniref:LysR family transcriptional regulator substrate-binding protein n=1 Tax=Streptomyces hirsutus TaxID=35620 RepID=UPI0033F8C6E6
MALPILDDHQLTVRSVARDEIVYLSSDPERARRPVTPARLADARLVLSEATWGERDYTRQQLTRAVQTAHRTLRPHIEVENVETALEIAARGHADTIAARGVVHRLAGQLPRRLHSAPLRPRLYDHFAIVHRRNTTLSRATRTLIDLATTRLRQATARGRQADP